MNKLQLLHVKGVSGEFDLAPITLITGRNSVGKTAILNAVTLALLGYVPAIGKRADLTFTLSSGPRMVVVADGATFVWEQKKAKVTATTPANFEPAPETMLDLNGLFSATKEARMMAILRACALPESMSTNSLLMKIRAVCPSYPTPKLVDRPLEDIEALTQTGKAYLKTLNDRVGEYEAASARHADELAKIPAEPVSLESQISEVSERQGVAKQKARQADDSVEERKRIVSKANSIVIPDAETLNSEKAQLLAQIEAAPVATADADEATLIKDRDEAQQKLEAARAKFTVLSERVLTLAEKDECPTCGHPVQDLDKSENKKKLAKLKDDGIEARKVYDVANQKLTDFRVAVNKSRASVQTWQKRISTIEAQIASIPQLEKARHDLMASLQALPEPESAALYREEVVALQAKLEALQQRQRYYVAAQSLRTTAELAVEQRKKEESRVDGAKLALKEIVDFRTDLLNKVSDTLLGTANRIIEPVLGKKLEFTDGDFTLGHAVLITLSGSERMVVFAGLQIALSAAYSPRIVLMDELGVVDHVRKEKLLGVVAQAIKDGVIQQFIAVDINPLGSTLLGNTTVIRLEGGGV